MVNEHIASEQVTPPLGGGGHTELHLLSVASTKALVKSTSLLPSVAGDPHTKSNGRRQRHRLACVNRRHGIVYCSNRNIIRRIPTRSSTRIAGDRGVVGERGDAGDIAESGRVRNQTVQPASVNLSIRIEQYEIIIRSQGRSAITTFDEAQVVLIFEERNPRFERQSPQKIVNGRLWGTVIDNNHLTLRGAAGGQNRVKTRLDLGKSRVNRDDDIDRPGYTSGGRAAPSRIHRRSLLALCQLDEAIIEAAL